MPDPSFFALAASDRADALELAASRSGGRAHLLEKDIWVVLTLQALFGASFGERLTFKGGTSLSKAYGVIRRFSEDIDVTYDIRALAPDLAGGNDLPLPPTRSQAGKWRSKIERWLHDWVRDKAKEAVSEALGRAGASAQARAEGDKVYVVYEPLVASGYGFVKPEVMVEFGGLSTAEPRVQRAVACDAADFVPGVAFPSASPFVMAPERTFWEKATLIHVFCKQQRVRGERLSRHWHDLVRLDDAGYAATALADRRLAEQVALHKSAFFSEKDADGAWVDYKAAVSGNLRLTPEGEARNALADDYERMVGGGVLYDNPEPFSELMERCADIEARANAQTP